MRIRRRTCAGAAIATIALLCGCASEERADESGAPAPAPTFEVPAGQFDAAFAATKDSLRDAGFVLNRIDARAGVITTAPRVASGIATPWAGAEATFGDAVEAAANVERRIVEVRFTPVAGATPGAWGDGPVTGEVSAAVWRVRSPGRRVASSSIRLTSYTSDPAMRERGLEPDFRTDLRPDGPLAFRVASDIQARLSGSGDARPPPKVTSP